MEKHRYCSCNTPRLHIRKLGMDEMICVLEPSAILVYGGEVEYDYQGIKVAYYGNHVTERMKNLKNEG